MAEYWPSAGSWERSLAGWDETALATALAVAREANSTDVAIVHAGRLVAHQIWTVDVPILGAEPLPEGGVRQDIASAQKSISSVLAGIAVGRGLLDIDSTVTSHLGAGWAGEARPPSEARITVRHLLSMTSGLADDMAFVAEPGTRWDYNLGAAYHTVKRVVSATAGLPLETLTEQWLTGPLGMTRSSWRRRQVSEGMNPVARSSALYPNGEPIEGFVTTALDLAKFGLSVSRGCRFAGGELGIDPGYASEMVRPSQALNPAYGLLWWLNSPELYLAPKNPAPIDGPFFAGVPGDAFAALGAQDRMCVVVPSLDLVVTRVGAAASPGSLGPSKFVRAFTAAVCAAWRGEAAEAASR